MAEKQVENAQLRFGHLDDVLQSYYKQNKSIIEAGKREEVLKVVQEKVSGVFGASQSDLKLGPIVFRESNIDADVFEACVPLVLPDIESTLSMQAYGQGMVTLGVIKNSAHIGWLKHELLALRPTSVDSQEQSIENTAGSQTEDTSEILLLSTRSLQQCFEQLVQQQVSEFNSKAAADLTLSSITPGHNENFFIGLELAGEKIQKLTMPPHSLQLRLTPVIEMTCGTFLLTSFSNSPYPYSLRESDSDFPLEETVFTYSLIAEEVKILEEDEMSALQCVRTLCSLRRTTQLCSPLISYYLLLNCVLLVKERKDVDGKNIWLQLSDGERFVEVMKFLLEYFMLKRLPWHFDSNAKLTLAMADGTEGERLRLVQYITQVFITRKFEWLIQEESSITDMEFLMESFL